MAGLGLIAGSAEIANTSIGWHLATGRWILAHGAVPYADPFSFTAQAPEWVDHEWLFQVTVALLDAAGGAPLLVVFRAVVVAALAVLLLCFGMRSRLAPAAALVLAALCLYGASIRFFLRPELATLLIAPTVVWIFLQRARYRTGPWLLTLAALMALGANLHAGVLVVPPLLAGLLAAHWLRREARSGHGGLARGALGLATVTAAPLLNPYGWHLYAVPIRIARLVGLPEIPNPEWLAPGPADVPALYGALVLGLLVLAMRERDPARWLLFLMSGALAVRYVRNVGLFFVLLPIAIAPALATVTSAVGPRRRGWAMPAAALVTLLVGLSIVLGGGFRLGWRWSASYYPHRACDFMEEEGLAAAPAYNDVRFGGYLIYRWFPPRQVFLDDRNEIHQPLLAEIHRLLQTSDQAGWQEMLDRFAVTGALLRYNPPFRVVTPEGEELGSRGFSALWFPADRWALVYWDDTAMVLVPRATADPGLVARHEYRLVRPDDLDGLRRRLVAEPAIRGPVAAELTRRLAEDPSCRRALALSELVLSLGP